MKQEMMGWQWHQLDHMQIMPTTPQQWCWLLCTYCEPSVLVLLSV